MRMRLDVLQERECGGCTECCDLLGVPEFGKKAHQGCQFADRGTGCRVYRVRPRSCRRFDCLWKQGWFDEAERPDRTGVILAMQYQHATQRPTLTLYVRDAAWERNPRLRALVQRHSAEQTIVVVSPTEHSILASEAEAEVVLANVNAFLARRGQATISPAALPPGATFGRAQAQNPRPVLHIRKDIHALLPGNAVSAPPQGVSAA